MLFDMFQTRSWGHGIMCQHRKLYLLTMKKLSSQSQRSARLRKRLHPADKASGEESVRGGGWRADGEGGYRAIGNLSPAKSGIICTCNRLGGMGTCVCIEPVTALNTQMTILYGVLAVNSTLRKSFFLFADRTTQRQLHRVGWECREKALIDPTTRSRAQTCRVQSGS